MTRPGDVVLTMGVGDVGNLAEEMLAVAGRTGERLRESSPS